MIFLEGRLLCCNIMGSSIGAKTVSIKNFVALFQSHFSTEQMVTTCEIIAHELKKLQKLQETTSTLDTTQWQTSLFLSDLFGILVYPFLIQ